MTKPTIFTSYLSNIFYLAHFGGAFWIILLKDYPQIAFPPPLTALYDKIAKETSYRKLKELLKRKEVVTTWYPNQKYPQYSSNNFYLKIYLNEKNNRLKSITLHC